jgi:hypothetical protein
MTDQPNNGAESRALMDRSLWRFQLPVVTLDNNPLVGYFNVEDNDPRTTPTNREDAAAVRELLALQSADVIRLMVTISTMFENQPAGKTLDVQAMIARLSSLGLDRQDIFAERRNIGISTPDEPNVGIYGADSDRWVSMFIHAVLNQGRIEPNAKNIDFTWPAYRDHMCAQEWARRGVGEIEMRAIGELDRLRMGIPPRSMPALDACSAEQRAIAGDILAHLFKQWNRASCDANGLVIHASHALYSPAHQQQHAVFVTSDKIIVRLSTREWLKAIRFPGHIMRPSEAVDHFKQMSGI